MVPTVSFTTATTFSARCCRQEMGTCGVVAPKLSPAGGEGRGPQPFPTCLRSAASLSSWTTSCPTQPEALKPLVQVSSTAWKRNRSRGQAALHPGTLPIPRGQRRPPTLSRPSCWQGKEKVKPRGRTCSIRFCLAWKSMMHSMMWSKSCGEGLWSGCSDAGGAVPRHRQPRGIPSPRPVPEPHRLAGALHDGCWDDVDLAGHVDAFLHHTHHQHAEIGAPQVQRQKVASLCGEHTRGGGV